MNENEFELDGKVYLAVAATCDCDGCAFFNAVNGCKGTPECMRGLRIDGRDVIFVEKPQ